MNVSSRTMSHRFMDISVAHRRLGQGIFTAFLVTTFGALASVPQLSWADEIRLKNGNRISGVIKQADKQRVQQSDPTGMADEKASPKNTIGMAHWLAQRISA